MREEESMPKIFTYLNFILFFFSNVHEPIHVHVQKGEFQSIFELIIEDGKLSTINVKNKDGYKPLPSKDITVIKGFIDYYHDEIVQKWIEFFVLRKKVSCTNITTKDYEK